MNYLRPGINVVVMAPLSPANRFAFSRDAAVRYVYLSATGQAAFRRMLNAMAGTVVRRLRGVLSYGFPTVARQLALMV